MPADAIAIRPVLPADREAIARLNDTAFAAGDASAETALLHALRRDDAMVLELIADDGGSIVGHIAFSRLTIDGPKGARPAVSLAPMAVAADRQRQGVGSRLVSTGLDHLRARGETIVFVIGHTDYYPRFGFSPDAARAFRCPWSDEAGDAHMPLALRPGALQDLSGRAIYPRAFDPLTPQRG